MIMKTTQKNIAITFTQGRKKAPAILVDVTGLPADEAYKHAVAEATKRTGLNPKQWHAV